MFFNLPALISRIAERLIKYFSQRQAPGLSFFKGKVRYWTFDKSTELLRFLFRGSIDSNDVWCQEDQKVGLGNGLILALENEP